MRPGLGPIGTGPLPAGTVSSSADDRLVESPGIVITVFIVVNLFIAVVINDLDATKAAEAAAAQPAGDLAGRLRLLEEELAALEAHVRQGRIES